MFDRFNVIVPYKAHGAATMFALGADEITMGEKGELSPINPSIPQPAEADDSGAEEKPPISVEDVTGLVSLLERFGTVREKQRIDAFLKTLEQVPALALGRANRACEQAKTVAMRLLNSRKRSFGESKNGEIIKGLFSGALSEHQSLSISEASKYIGLKHAKRANDLESVFWELLNLYEVELKVNEPFQPEDVIDQANEEQATFPNQKLVYLETTRSTRVLKHDVRIKAVRKAGTTVRFNPQIVLPPFEVPPELQSSEETILRFMREWLQDHLPDMIAKSLEKLQKDSPIVAYERLNLNREWIDE
jgi:hypothetical protein